MPTPNSCIPYSPGQPSEVEETFLGTFAEGQIPNECLTKTCRSLFAGYDEQAPGPSDPEIDLEVAVEQHGLRALKRMGSQNEGQLSGAQLRTISGRTTARSCIGVRKL